MAFGWNFFKRKEQERQEDFEQPQDALSQHNENYRIFKDVYSDLEQIVSARSVVDQQMRENDVSPFANPIWQTLMDGKNLLLPVATNKKERLDQYRTISRFPECDWCLDEICDDFIHENDDGDVITLQLPEESDHLNDTKKDILQNEFRKYMELFRLKDDGFNLVKRYLIEGELCWENVIKNENPELGIIGVKFLPAEYYETLLDSRTNKPVGIYFDTERFTEQAREFALNNYYSSTSQIFSTMAVGVSVGGFDKDTCIPFLYPQITYISSGDVSYDGLINYPILEKTKQAYHQLALLQDAAVILRVTRAPERLLFNVSTGRMNQNYADAYVRNFAMSLKSKKVPTHDGKDIASVYNPVTMLESYIFGKSDGNDGTSVESVGSSADYEQIADIEYFLRRLMKQFKVPFTRYKTPENTMERDETISYEEYSFARMVVRNQRRFASGFKRGFITHLKLRDIWEKYNLKESDLDIEFVKPVLYDLYQTQKLVGAKMDIYGAIVDRDEMSKILAMKKYLGMTDKEIEENFMTIAKEKMLAQLGDYWTGKLDERGPSGSFAKEPIPLAKEQKDDEGGGDEGGSDESGNNEREPQGKSEPPTFGLG